MNLFFVFLFVALASCAQRPFLHNSYQVEARGFGLARFNATISFGMQMPQRNNTLLLEASYINGTGFHVTRRAFSDINEWGGAWLLTSNNPTDPEQCSYAENQQFEKAFDLTKNGWLVNATLIQNPNPNIDIWESEFFEFSVPDVQNGHAYSYFGLIRLAVDAKTGDYKYLVMNGGDPLYFVFTEQPRVVTTLPTTHIPKVCLQKPAVCPANSTSEKILLYRNHGNATELFVQLNDTNLASADGEANWLCGRGIPTRSPLLTAFELTIDPRFTEYMLCNRGHCDAYFFGQQWGIGKQNNEGTPKCEVPKNDNKTCDGYCSGGTWYSFPSLGRCPPGQPLGTVSHKHGLGCTWLDKYAIKKSIEVACLHKVSNGFNCTGKTIHHMGKVIEQAFTLCPDVQNSSWPHPHHRKRTVAEDMRLRAHFAANDDSQHMAPRTRPVALASSTTFKAVSSNKVRPLSLAAARLPYMAGDYTFNATVLGSRYANVSATFFGPTKAAPSGEMFVETAGARQSQRMFLSALDRYQGIVGWDANVQLQGWRDCSYQYNSSFVRPTYDLSKKSSWMNSAKVGVVNGMQIIDSTIRTNFTTLSGNSYADYANANLSYATIVTDMRGTPLLMFVSTGYEVQGLLFNSTLSRPTYFNKTNMNAPAECVTRSWDKCNATANSMVIKPFLLHNATRQQMQLLGNTFMDIASIPAYYTSYRYYLPNIQYLSQYQLTVDPHFAPGAECNPFSRACTVHSYAQAFGVGHANYPSGDRCDTSIPSTPAGNCSYGYCPSYGNYYTFPTPLGQCGPHQALGTNNCTFSQPQIAKTVSWQCVQQKGGTNFTLPNTQTKVPYAPFVLSIIKGFQACPHINVPIP